MSFTTPCYIQKNTPELRNNLEELGYCQASALPFSYLGTLSSIGAYVTIPVMSMQGSIDCGTNEPLFLAIAALRDDTDYMQWFTDGSDFILCDREDWIDMYSVLCSGKWSSYQNELDKYHKATVEELIERFKTKEQ